MQSLRRCISGLSMGLLLFLLTTGALLFPVGGLYQYVWQAVAGSGSANYSGDSQSATTASLNQPHGICIDAAGNIFIGDQTNHRVRKIDGTTGIITTYAGSGVAGFGGDTYSVKDSSVQLWGPLGVWKNSVSVLFIVDSSNHRIRVVSSAEIISTFAGNGNAGYYTSDDNQPATNAHLNYPQAVVGDSTGVVYISDSANNRIRRVSVGKIITTVVGDGTTTAVNNVAAMSTGLNSPSAIWMMSTGDYYIADVSNNLIRKVSSGIITTVAGGGANLIDHVAATKSLLSSPFGVWVSDVDNSIYIADSSHYRIRAVDGITGNISTIAGTGVSTTGADDIAATSSGLLGPVSVSARLANMIYVVDKSASKVRLLTCALPTSQPSGQPSSQPSGRPTRQLSAPRAAHQTFPTSQPTSQLSRHPSRERTRCPSARSTDQPTQQPSQQAEAAPSALLTSRPSSSNVNNVTQPVMAGCGNDLANWSSSVGVRTSNTTLSVACVGSTAFGLNSTTWKFTAHGWASAVSIPGLGMRETKTTVFQATVLSAQALSASSGTRSWIVLAVVMAIVVIGAVGLVLTRCWDSRSASITQSECESGFQGVDWWTLPPAEWTTDMMLSVSQLMPPETAVLTMSRVREAITQHHRWLNIVNHYCRHIPRSIRLMSLLSNIIVILFLQSLIYAFIIRDDGSCSAQHTRETCESLLSTYHIGDSQCRWDFSAAICQYIDPSSNASVSIFVSLFATLIASPLWVCNDWILTKVLMAPSLESEMSKNIEDAMASVAVVPEGNGSSKSSSVDSSVAAELNQDWTMFVVSLQQQWRQLVDEERKTFEAAWGLDEKGSFDVSDCKNRLASLLVRWEWPRSVENRIRTDMRTCLLAANVEKQWTAASNETLSLRVLFCFQRDLLAGLTEQLIDIRDQQQHWRSSARSVLCQRFCVLWLLLQSLGMLCYLFLFGVTENQSQQRAWIQSFATWLVLDIVIFSCVLVAVYHVLLPLLFWSRSDLPKLASVFDDLISNFRWKVEEGKNAVSFVLSFNAARFFFVSHRIARYWHELAVSNIVLQYVTIWPRRTYGARIGTHCLLVDGLHIANDNDDTSLPSVSSLGAQVAMAFLSRALSCPLQLQIVMMQWVLTALVGSLVLMHRWLYNIHPVLVMLPTATVLVLVGLRTVHCDLRPHQAHIDT